MRILRSTFVVVMLMTCSCCSNYAQQYTKQIQISRSGQTLSYRVTLPDNFQKNHPYPVLIAPGSGKQHDDYDLFFGKNPQRRGWILVESPVNIKGIEAMKELVAAIDAEFHPEGIHLLGFSANSVGAFQAALALPDAFQSITAIPGHPRTNAKEKLLALKNMKIQIIVGEKDGWWKSEALHAQKRLKAMDVDVRVTIVPNGGHVLREFAGDSFFEALNQLRK